MSSTLLSDPQAAAGTNTVEYHGAQTVANFGDVLGELRALRSGLAVCDLAWRAKLTVAGPDRIRWMNGMVTNNIKDLLLDHGCYNFLLNAQGRILGDLYVFNRGDYLLMDTDLSQAAKLAEIFDRFIIMDDVQVENTSEKLASIGIRGVKSAAALQSSGIDIPALEPLRVFDTVWQEKGISVVRAAAALGESYEIWSSPANLPAIWEALIAAGAQPVGSHAIELDRIARGVPTYGQDIRERDLPQETEQRQALHFQKGCYVGQEIVERIHARGNVHRKFTGFTFSGALPVPGTRLQKEGKDVAEVTSAATLPLSQGARNVGLGYVRREVGAVGAQLNVAGSAEVATVGNLPFENL